MYKHIVVLKYAIFPEILELERLCAAKVTFKVTRSHWYWYYSIGHILSTISLPLQLWLCLVTLPKYCELFPKILTGNVKYLVTIMPFNNRKLNFVRLYGK